MELSKEELTRVKLNAKRLPSLINKAFRNPLKDIHIYNQSAGFDLEWRRGWPFLNTGDNRFNHPFNLEVSVDGWIQAGIDIFRGKIWLNDLLTSSLSRVTNIMYISAVLECKWVKTVAPYLNGYRFVKGVKDSDNIRLIYPDPVINTLCLSEKWEPGRVFAFDFFEKTCNGKSLLQFPLQLPLTKP